MTIGIIPRKVKTGAELKRTTKPVSSIYRTVFSQYN